MAGEVNKAQRPVTTTTQAPSGTPAQADTTAKPATKPTAAMNSGNTGIAENAPMAPRVAGTQGIPAKTDPNEVRQVAAALNFFTQVRQKALLGQTMGDLRSGAKATGELAALQTELVAEIASGIGVAREPISAEALVAAQARLTETIAEVVAASAHAKERNRSAEVALAAAERTLETIRKG